VQSHWPLISLALGQLAGYSHSMGEEAGERGVLLRLVSLTGDEIRSLGEAMYAVSAMRSPNGRQQVLEFVKARNHAFNPQRSNVDTEEINNFIVACRADDESFDLLLESIEARVPPDDLDLYRLQKLVGTLLPRALVTGEELRKLLALKPGTVVGPDQLAVGIGKAIRGQTGNECRHREPPNIREAMLLLLDAPSPEEGLRRLLRFADWLAELASVAGNDPSIAEQLRELAVRVGRAHGMPQVEWRIPVEATRQDVASAASTIGVQEASPEHAVTGNRLPEQRSQASGRSTGLNSREGVARVMEAREERRYLAGDNDSALTTLSPHERSLGDLRNALKRIKSRIFRDPRLKSRELDAAKKALESVDPLVAALSEAARQESEQPMRDDLLQLEDDLRNHLEALSRELATLDSLSTPIAAKKPCDRLAREVAEFLDAGERAIRHVT
jgi:hypothetical protein